MYAHAHSSLFSDRYDFFEKVDQVGAHALCADVDEFSNGFTQTVSIIGLGGARQASDNIAFQQRDLRLSHCAEPGASCLQNILRIIRSCVFSFQNENVIGSKICHFKTQGFRRIGQLIIEVGARPVHNRHKVVAHRIDAHSPDVPQGFFIVLNPLYEVARTCLDIVVYRNTLDHRPNQPGVLNRLLTLPDVSDRPGITCGNVV